MSNNPFCRLKYVNNTIEDIKNQNVQRSPFNINLSSSLRDSALTRHKGTFREYTYTPTNSFMGFAYNGNTDINLQLNKKSCLPIENNYFNRISSANTRSSPPIFQNSSYGIWQSRNS